MEEPHYSYDSFVTAIEILEDLMPKYEMDRRKMENNSKRRAAGGQLGDRGGEAPLCHFRIAFDFVDFGNFCQTDTRCVQQDFPGVEAGKVLRVILKVLVFGKLAGAFCLFFEYLCGLSAGLPPIPPTGNGFFPRACR